jgi:hypothetical protein
MAFHWNHWLSGPLGKGRSVLLVLIAVGLAFLAVSIVDYFVARSIRADYLRTPCAIDHFHFTETDGRTEVNMPGSIYLPQVQYTYEVAGERYTSRVLCWQTQTYRSRAEAEKVQAQYGPGSDSMCYVHPTRPQEAMLILPDAERAGRWCSLSAGAILFLVVTLGTLELLANWDTRKTTPIVRAPEWGEADAGPNDPLARTRGMLKNHLDS